MAFYEESLWERSFSFSFSFEEDDDFSVEEPEEVFDEYEYEEEIHQNPFGLWPYQANYEWRPNVEHLARLYAPIPVKPEELLPEVQAAFDTYKVTRRETSHAKAQAEKKLTTKSEEMKKAEAEPEKPKSYSSKWSDKAKGSDGDGKKALLKRLGDEFEELALKVQKEIDALAKLDAANASIVKMKESHEACVEGYDAYKIFIEGNSRKIYGKYIKVE